MKWLRVLFHTFGASVSMALSVATAGVLLALVGLVLWVGSEGSLAQALKWATPWLPAGHSLQASEVTGDLQSGGRIGHVVWKQGQRTLELRNLQLAWDWRAAVQGELRLTQAHAEVLHWDDRTPSNEDPFTAITLPLRVDAQWAVDTLQWAGPPALALQSVQGHYRFDGSTHHLERTQLSMAAGSYQLEGQLQAQLPGALQLRATGQVQAPVPGQQQTAALDASATVQGHLYGKEAALALRLDVKPQAGSKGGPLGGMQAQLQAELQPALRQPIANAQAHWSALDLATLWPQATQTLLSGEAQVLPVGEGWRAQLQLQNRQEGPLSQNRLPLQSATASVLYRNNQWQLEALQASAAGGRLSAQGSYTGNADDWAANGSVQGIDPTRIDPRWKLPPLDGEATARQTPQGLVFDALLQGSVASGKQANRLQAKGVWNGPMLALESLQLQTADARIEGQLQLDTRSLAAQGALSANLPGAQLGVRGSAGPTQGQGSAEGQVKDAAALLRWLGPLPLLGPAMDGLDLEGAFDLAGSWSGGWQNKGAGLLLDSSMRSQRLQVQGAALSDVRVQAKGSLADLAVQFSTRLQAEKAAVQLQAQAQWLNALDDQWTARISTFQASVTDGLQPVPWNLQLQQAVALQGQRAALLETLRLSAGLVRLTGPAPGAAQLSWEPVQFTRPRGSAPGSARWASRGQLQGVPLSWLEVLGQTKLSNFGLRGDLLLGGQWDAREEDGLQLRARLQRSSGDLQLLSGEANGSTLPAGLREAYVDVLVDRQTVQAKLLWASEAGGNAQADLSTRLERQAGAWVWPTDAPLQGRVQANLPRVGAWSLFAPVGWRINGTLDANAVLSGSRASPHWKGTLAARDMAIRSVVDGVDLSQGLMRLALDGQHMEVLEFSVQGAGGSSGGTVQVTGSVDWLPASAGGTLTQRLKMALDAKAQSFRVTARPDERIVVSGTLRARLQEARLSLHGALVADQALIVLPEDSAPKLGRDVVVKRPSAPAKAPAARKEPAKNLAGGVTRDLHITLDPGPNFHLQGQGIDTRLAGLLTLKTQGTDPTPLLTGELRTVNGSYRAYGQSLTIEDGKLIFGGAYDNPTLDIRAVRPNLQQVVGVLINGTAQLPVIRLFSEPDLSEMEKLSWLVLGRSSSNGGGETAILQQAALALFAGRGASARDNLVNAFGLDEVSLGQAATTNLDGSTGTAATVKFGKRLSRDFYVAYERSLAGTLGTLYVFYDLSRRFTLRAEAGSTQAVDLIFTTRYD